MRAFAQAYPDEEFVQQAAAQIPWFHNCVLLDKVKDSAEREWYIVSAVDDLLRHPHDQPTIGIILCKSKNKVFAEYSLRDMNKPIGVSMYQLRNNLPEDFQGNLPTIEQLEAELETVDIKRENQTEL